MFDILEWSIQTSEVAIKGLLSDMGKLSGEQNASGIFILNVHRRKTHPCEIYQSALNSFFPMNIKY